MSGTHIRIWARICCSLKFPHNIGQRWDMVECGTLDSQPRGLALLCRSPLLRYGTAHTCSGLLPFPYRQRHHQMLTCGDQDMQWQDLPICVYVKAWLLWSLFRHSGNNSPVDILLGKCVEKALLLGSALPLVPSSLSYWIWSRKSKCDGAVQTPCTGKSQVLMDA